MSRNADYWIERFNMLPHPEGGYFKEVYRSREFVQREHLPERYDGERNFVTSIYFLLDKTQTSKFHRLKSDEIWYHLDGNGALVHIIYPDGKRNTIKLGYDYDKGEHLQAVIPMGSWFGAEVTDKAGYCLVGCAVAPGFNFNDFELAKRENLLNEFPDYADIINKLT
ncbi:MAG: cupin domain-containing protein [Ignavibacteriaceae bacterium]|jgi:Uncharacterized conserved protein|nr:MAG: cupin domain-containing protein [Chlorobiota bacterium]KXK06250.1 MAG: hypothetical protein UZ04_CHB001000252 [Chlorobi bacterium OLB4]MBV6399238.1 hypothetical protein [Ignavibacteria bacterium]MCC6884911.1 cupin domain-containing protein [Ignavibacteriales bacterium]MCE7953558.1 cupin domain-containing protein [Chlorobi bacterium CHB7]MDL1887552.1 cupin domain-containing protein [Ignavibacteria bacterium CHB1]MEB2329320.1 cupin domain-containing protein [Ignavibacteriaceae bacterium